MPTKMTWRNVLPDRQSEEFQKTSDFVQKAPWHLNRVDACIGKLLRDNTATTSTSWVLLELGLCVSTATEIFDGTLAVGLPDPDATSDAEETLLPRNPQPVVIHPKAIGRRVKPKK